ncbi:hypothetical protein [Nocardioides sp.]|uniref:hypothetical protein n=1 Tax=Nocardioides sp. TaxID=35761 RepID=UPI002719FC3B|nr:hypothetical protein [Nocardioides sp.]MDO9456641.1 hypothetical protein [Nocardioides sp.]
MSQTASAPAPQPAPSAQPAVPATAQPSHRAGVAPAASPFSENVPRLLNRLQAVAVTTCVVFGILAAVIQVLSWQAAGRAADNTEQVVRVQQIQSLLLRADAVATSSYLSDGLEPAAARAEYDAAIDDTLRLITDAADAQPADRAVLADLNAAVSAYTTTVSQARDYNRQQLPIGIAYLNNAGTSLRAEALPIVTALVDTNSERAEDEMHGQHPFWLLGIGVLALLTLFWVNSQVARRFRRRLNVGVVTAEVIIAVLTLVAVGHAVLKNNDDDATRDGAYRTAIDEASARTAANNAKAFESLGLVNRGSGSTVWEPQFQKQSEIVVDKASADTAALWSDYLDLHAQLRDKDDQGLWDAAVADATATGDGTVTAALDAVDASASAVVDESGDEASDGFREGGAISVALAIITLLGGLIAAGAATRGIDQRRKEYS